MKELFNKHLVLWIVFNWIQILHQNYNQISMSLSTQTLLSEIPKMEITSQMALLLKEGFLALIEAKSQETLVLKR